MFSKSTLKFALGCAVASIVGFSATLMAWPYGGSCEACHMGCWQGYYHCINSGYTQQQCQQSVAACIYYDCNNCLIP